MLHLKGLVHLRHHSRRGGLHYRMSKSKCVSQGIISVLMIGGSFDDIHLVLPFRCQNGVHFAIGLCINAR